MMNGPTPIWVYQADEPVIVTPRCGIAAAPSVTTMRPNERRILGRLQDVPGCQVLPNANGVAAFDGLPLDQSGYLGQPDLGCFLDIAERLSRVIAAIHARGVIHMDINPAHVLLRQDDGALQVIGFGLATTFIEEPAVFDHRHLILSTPAFMSPEQTGQMNRPVDYRTDLYSLGATLYLLATGRPPFTLTDKLGLLHAHLAISPEPPETLAPWLPGTISALILTLLEKEPAGRYQSAAGLVYDIQQLRSAVAEGTPLDRVPLQRRDMPLFPRSGRQLYGRDREVAALLDAVSATRRGGVQMVFIAGYSGVGKTCLIQEIARPVGITQGLFITGKFEQFQQDRPFLAPGQSILQLCHLLLAKPEAKLDAWRRRIAASIGPDAEVLFDLVPDLAVLLGPQPPAPALGPLETRVRLRAKLLTLIRAVASPERPLVLFLDDLQWADQPSLDFIAGLLEEPAADGLLLIGAFRDNEVDAAHPLNRLLRHTMASGHRPTLLTLGNLAETHLADLLADRLHMSADAVEPLAVTLHARTDGNPFFALEFLNALYRDGLLTPDLEECRWRWDKAAVFRYEASQNVVEFLVAGLATLSNAATDVLVAAACLGNAFTLGLLARATDMTPEDLVDRLMPALERGILLTPRAHAIHQADPTTPLRFCHDRMQQAIYQRRDDALRPALHLAIARRFAEPTDDTAQQFSAAEHYAQAASLIAPGEEQCKARGLFLTAAIRARQAGSFATAERFLRLAIALLGLPPWVDDPAQAFRLHVELHQVLYSQSLYDEADGIYAMLLRETASPEGLVDPTCTQVASLSNRTRFGDALRLGSALLERLDVAMPAAELGVCIEDELRLFYQAVESGALDRLPTSRPMTDPALLGAAKLMNRLEPCAYFSDEPRFGAWFGLRNIRLAITHGHSDAVIFPLADVIGATVMGRDDYATGCRAGRIAMAMVQAGERSVEQARALYIFAAAVSHWFQPLSESVRHAQTAFDSLLRGGDLEFGCYSYFTTLAAVLDSCADLDDMKVEIAAAFTFAQKTGNRSGEESYLPFRQLVRSLEGLTAEPGRFDDDEFDEQAHLQAAQANRMAIGYLHIYRALAAAIFGDSTALIHHADAARALEPWVIGMYPVALITFLHALALAARLATTDDAGRPKVLDQLCQTEAWLAARSAEAPMNFSHLHRLVQAERLDATGQPWNAAKAFERAMWEAQAHQRPWHHALITEHAGRFHMRHGLEHAGRALLLRAHNLYRHWGALGKARIMQGQLPFLAAHGVDEARERLDGTLDYEALLRASQALTSETSPAMLVARFVELVGQLSGATDAWLLLLNEMGQWYVESVWQDGGITTPSRLSLADAEARHLIPSAALRLALKTMAPMVSDDAVIDSRFKNDPHFLGQRLCSLLALPVLLQGRATAFLMLENKLYRAAFSAEQIETVSFLCGQLAISLENARLYQSLERKVDARTHDLAVANAKLQHLTETDILTGIANRRKFETVWAEAWETARRHRLPLSVAIVDVDHFKAYNDHYGHPAGDDCLRHVAQLLHGALRPELDLLARLGGEEFVVVQPGLTAAQAPQVAERLRQAVQDGGILHQQNEAAAVVTVSIGVASCTPTAESLPQDLLSAADAALYQAKRTGRNRWSSAVMRP